MTVNAVTSEPEQRALPAIRLMMIAPGEIFGGAERQILALLRAMRKHAACALITFNDTELAQFAREEGLQVIVVGAQGLIDFASLRRLREALRAFTPTVVHIHGYRAAVYCALAGRRQSGYVKTEHGRIESGSGRVRDRLRTAAYGRLERFAARRLKAHIVYVTQDLAGSHPMQGSTLRRSVIYNGIEPCDRSQTRRPPEYSRDFVNLAIVGRLERIKGIEYAIQAMAHPAMPKATHLHIVGTGPLREQLERRAMELDVERRVHFEGFRRNAYDYIAHADALLMPSLHEGLPYTILEAMSLETPILASRVGGLAEVLQHGSTALLFDPANATAICENVQRLLQQGSLRDELVRGALADSHRRFTADIMAGSYIDLYRSLRPPRTTRLSGLS